MSDIWIIVTTAVLFPLFGLGVFFFWRYKYGVWSPAHRARTQRREDVRVIRTDEAPKA
ncbi:MAG: hypothetical protein AB7K52_09655 [Phycisphaerales bacterium]